MSEKVILNEHVEWDDNIEDSTTPDYGFTWNTPSRSAIAKPSGGRPYSREVTNEGHTFTLSWINRSFLCVQRIRWFYNQFKRGYFTIIDHDGGGRHCVGRFTGNLQIAEAGNDKYVIQNLTFEEIPGVPMLVYPSDWDRDSIIVGPVDDDGMLIPAISGVWSVTPMPAGFPVVLTNAGTDTSNFATTEYCGYGFRLYMRKGPNQGKAQIAIDGASYGDPIDLYNATDIGLVCVLEVLALSLDFHRVKVSATAQKNAASSATTVTYGYLRVMQ